VAAAAAVCRWISWWIWAGWDLCWRWWRWVWRFIFFDGFEAEDAQVIEGDVAGEAEFDDSDGVEVLDDDGFARLRGFVQRLRGTLRQARIVCEIPKNSVGVDNDPAQSKNCSRGKLPHISLRALAMSSSENEIPRFFHNPRMLFRGRFVLVPRKLTKSRTSCWRSGVSSRNLAITASSIGVAAIALIYRERLVTAIV